MPGALRHGPRLARAALALARHETAWPADLGPKPGWLTAAGRLARLWPRPDTLPAPSPEEGLARTLEALGPALVKLGQLLATRPDIVGPRLAGALAVLQDRLPPFGQAEARATIAREFDRPVESLFDTFGPPVAAASIAQVHRAHAAARLGHNRPPPAANDPGDAPAQDLAVKVLRPGIEKVFARDLESFFWAARLLERLSPAARRLEPVKVVETLAGTVALELDLRLEGAAAAELAQNMAGEPRLRVPAVDWSRTSRRVLTLEWIEATPIGRRSALEAAGHDLASLATTVIQTFLTQAVRDGFFHADLHAGNLFVDRDSRLVVVDFGIMGRLDPATRRYLAEILFGFITGNYGRIAEVHFEAGYVPARHSVAAFAQALRAIGEPIQGRGAADISMARLLAQLFETTALFDMRLRPELLLLQKTMVAAEGVARSLDPDHNLWAAARPVLERFLARELGPEGRLQTAAEGAAALGRLAGRLPSLIETLERAARRVADTGLAFDPPTLDALAPTADRRQGRDRGLLLALSAALLLALLLALG